MSLILNGTTGVGGVDGSASAPATRGTDANTGISYAADTISLNTAGATKAILTADGNLGIGAPNPSQKLVVQGSGTTIATIGNTDDGTAQLVLSNVGSINFNLKQIAGATIFDQGGSERMRMQATGHLLIGQSTTSIPSGSGTVGAAIRQDGTAHFSTGDSAALNINRNNTGDIQIFQRSGLVKGEVHINASRVAYQTTSDYRLKENITTLSNGITRLKTLKPSRFNFKADSSNTIDGFIAHELQTVVPESVSGTKDGVDSEGEPIYQGVDNSLVVPLLTAALQEAVAKIEVLETKVAALEAG